MKNINNAIRTLSVGAVLAVAFAIALAAPASANACNSGCGGGYIQSSYVTQYGNNYGYGHSQPIVVTQPQIIYTQPQVTYQYQQPIYQPAPVYQQPVYQQPVYQQPTYYYQPLTVSCYSNSSSVQTGSSVTWTAYATGGNGTYSYTWVGTNGTYTTGSTGYSAYYTAGSYTASVTVYSNGQSVTQSCGYVNVTNSYSYNYAQPTYAYPATYSYQTVAQNYNSGNLVAACFADRTSTTIGTPVTWSVEVTGGTGQYTYNWSGTDGLGGTGSSAVQSYGTTGAKNATVLINSGGQTISQACGDSVTVHSYYAPSVGPGQSSAGTNVQQSNPGTLPAAAFISLGSIPWGWIAILIIIILIVAVFYLIFNRHKV
jgi:hypothetical protein